MSDSFRRVNGKTYDAGSVILKIFGETYEGWKSFKADQKRTRVRASGMTRHRKLRVRTKGTTEPGDITVSMLKATAQSVRDDACAISGSESYGDAEGPIVLQFVEEGLDPITEVYERCCIIQDGTSVEDNADPLYEDVVFQPMGVKKNGKTLSASRRS